MSVIFFVERSHVCAGQLYFFSSFSVHTHAGLMFVRAGPSVWVAARSLCPGIVKNVVLDSSCANE